MCWASLKTKLNKPRVIVVFPSKNENSTIEACIKAAKESRYHPGVIVSDGYSNDNSREIASEVGAEVVLANKVIISGKGASMKTGLESALKKNPDIVIFMDSDIWNLMPDWIDLLVAPLLNDECDISKGRYYMTPTEGAVTQIVAKPLLQAFFPEVSWLEQPLAGEVAARSDVWRTLMANNPPEGWGIDVWFLVEAAIRKLRIKEVFLGIKEHRSSLNHSADPGLLRRKGEQVAFTIINEAISYQRMNNAIQVHI